MSVPSDIEIAQKAVMKPIKEVAAGIGIPEAHLENYGHYKAKISFEFLDSLKSKKRRQVNSRHRNQSNARW